MVWSLSMEAFKRWLDRVLDKLILTPFLMKGWTKFVIQGHLQPWLLILWTAFPSGRYLTLAIVDGESPGRVILHRQSQMISTKVISNYQHTGNLKLPVHAHFWLLFSLVIAGDCPLGAMRDRCWKGGAKHPIKCLHLTSKLHFPLDSPTFISSPTIPF